MIESKMGGATRPTYVINAVLAKKIYVERLNLNQVARIRYVRTEADDGRKVKRFAIEFAPLIGERRTVGEYEPGYVLELPETGSRGGASPTCRFGRQCANGNIDLEAGEVIKTQFATPGTRYSELYYSRRDPLEVLEKSLTTLARDMAQELKESEISETFVLIRNLHIVSNLAFAAELAVEARTKELRR